MKKYPKEATEKGIVFAYDVRKFSGNGFLHPDIFSPIKDLDGAKLSSYAASVYVANGIPVYYFRGPRSTPELSFAIRHLKTISGIVFSASHNPADHNGKKIYDHFGGQLIPPFDEELVREVHEHVSYIQSFAPDELGSSGLYREL